MLPVSGSPHNGDSRKANGPASSPYVDNNTYRGYNNGYSVPYNSPHIGPPNHYTDCSPHNDSRSWFNSSKPIYGVTTLRTGTDRSAKQSKQLPEYWDKQKKRGWKTYFLLFLLIIAIGCIFIFRKNILNIYNQTGAVIIGVKSYFTKPQTISIPKDENKGNVDEQDAQMIVDKVFEEDIVIDDNINDIINEEEYIDDSAYDVVNPNDAAVMESPSWTIPWIQGKEFTSDITMDHVKGYMEANNGFNVPLSDSLPLSRPFHAPIPHICMKNQKEWKKLKWDVLIKGAHSLSVVIPIYNEPLSFILRTLVTLYERTPEALIKEVILVDDSSTVDWLAPNGDGYIYDLEIGGKSERLHLDNYLEKFPKLQFIRLNNESRLGPSKAKLAGLKAASGEVVFFADAHVEFDFRWSEVMIERILSNPNHVVVPRVHQLIPETMDVSSALVEPPVGFYWKLLESSIASGKIEPFNRSPMLGAGIFGAHRKTFLDDFGGFDSEMPGKYGLDMVELSLRIWMTGGIIEHSACSNVQHVFRRNTNKSIDPSSENESSPTHQIYLNKIRTILLWFDKPYDMWIYNLLGSPSGIDLTQLGEITERKRWIKKRKGNRNTRWFLDKVFTRATLRYPDSVKSIRFIKNKETGKCMHQGKGRHQPGVSPVTVVDCPDEKDIKKEIKQNIAANIQDPSGISLLTIMNPLHQYSFIYNSEAKVLLAGTNDEASICDATSCETSVPNTPGRDTRSGLQLNSLSDSSDPYIYMDFEELSDQEMALVHPSGYCVTHIYTDNSIVMRPCDLRDDKQKWIVSTIIQNKELQRIKGLI